MIGNITNTHFHTKWDKIDYGRPDDFQVSPKAAKCFIFFFIF